MRIRKLVILFTCLFFLGCSDNDPVYHDTQDQSIQLSKLKDKWVIVNYWASWCHSCMQEIKELNSFNKHLQNNIILLGVNYDHLSLDELQKAITKAKITFPILTENPSETWHFSAISAVPTTFILDPTGHVVKTITGPTTEKKLVDTLQTLQKEQHV